MKTIKKYQSGGGGKAKKDYVKKVNTADSLYNSGDQKVSDSFSQGLYIKNYDHVNSPLTKAGVKEKNEARKLKEGAKSKKPLGPTKFQTGGKVGKKAPLGSKAVGKPYEKNPGESGKNFGKSDAGKLKPTMGGAKNGKSVKKK